jgi:hypothetical protein
MAIQFLNSQDIDGTLSVSGEALINGLTVGKGYGEIGSNTVLGVASLGNNTTGAGNTGVGYRSLYSNTTGVGNVGVGAGTLLANSTEDSNTAIGESSLTNLTTGDNNTALGRRSGVEYADGGNLTSASNSVFLGYDTWPDKNGETNQIVIGYAARGGGSDTVTIGNKDIKKSFLRGTIYLNSYNSTNQTGTPTYLLGTDVNGTVVKTLATSGAAGNWTLTGNDIYNNNTGNVGIGITAPIPKLHVYQNDADAHTTNGITIEQDGTGDAALAFLLTGTKRWKMGIDNSDGDKFKISSNSSLGAENAITIDSSRNVGIGTQSPVDKLHIYQNDAGTTVTDGITIEQDGAGDAGLTFKLSGGQEWKMGIDNSDSDKFKISKGTYLGADDAIVIDTSERVGIGTTTTSSAKLNLKGGAHTILNATSVSGAPLFVSGQYDAFGTYFGTLSSGAGMIQPRARSTQIYYDLLLNPYGGDVGIGTTNPVSPLHIKRDNYPQLKIEATSGTWGIGVGSSNNLAIYNQNGGNYPVWINSSSQVGLNKTNPSERLDVNGNVRADKYINQRVAWNSGFNHGKGSGYQYIPVGYMSLSTTSNYYNNWIAPYAGRVKKIVLRNIGTGTAPTATTVNFRVTVNGTVVYTGSTITVTGSGYNIIASDTLSDTAATFSATDMVQVSFNTNGWWYYASAGISLEYTE